jgi:hypothetical protein
VRRHKEWEAKLRRDYYGYLQTREPQAETFEQHLERYGFLARIGVGATPQELEELQALAGVSLPPELREFYTFFGELQVSNPGESAISLFSVPELMRRLRLQGGWQRFRSLGLIHMMNASWENHRPELEPESGLLDAEEIGRLNAAYTCVGWITDGTGEGFHYIYFDRAGAFGTVYYHQDEFDELYSESLMPMQSRSPANSTLSSIVTADLRRFVPQVEGRRDDRLQGARRGGWRVMSPAAFAGLIRDEGAKLGELHAQVHRTFLQRDRDAQSRLEWERACEAFHHYASRMDSCIELARRKRRYSEKRLLEFVVCFLEVDPWFRDSGYLKEIFLTRLKRSDLDEETQERLRRVLLDAVARRGTREFKRYCRLAAVIADEELVSALEEAGESPKGAVASRARFMLGVVRQRQRERAATEVQDAGKPESSQLRSTASPVLAGCHPTGKA